MSSKNSTHARTHARTHGTHKTAKVFSKKVGEEMVVYIKKTVEEIVAVVKKSLSGYGK